MRTTLVSLIACSILVGTAWAGTADRGGARTQAARPVAAAPARDVQATATEAPAKKGLKSWFKTLKERFLRRCQDPWAPDPAPGQ